MKFGRFLVLVEVCRGKKFLLLIDFLVDVAWFKKNFVRPYSRLFLHIIMWLSDVGFFIARKLFLLDVAFPICVFPDTVAQVIKTLAVKFWEFLCCHNTCFLRNVVSLVWFDWCFWLSWVLFWFFCCWFVIFTVHHKKWDCICDFRPGEKPCLFLVLDDYFEFETFWIMILIISCLAVTTDSILVFKEFRSLSIWKIFSEELVNTLLSLFNACSI